MPRLAGAAQDRIGEMDRFSPIQLTDPQRLGRALLHASRASYELGRAVEARNWLERARESAGADDVLALEVDVQDAAISLWLEQRTPEGREVAEDAGVRARRLVADAGGVEALGVRARRAFVNALRVEHEAAMQMDDPEAMLTAAEDWAAAVRGFDEESHLAGSMRAGVALMLLARLPEAESRTEVGHAWTESRDVSCRA